MSLSKPFPLFDLPLVALENVLLLLKPKDLLFFALSSEKARELLRKLSSIKYFDIDVEKYAVIFSIRFKSEDPLRWKLTMKLPINVSVKSRYSANVELLDIMKEKIGVFELDGRRMDLFKHLDEMRCSLPKEHFSYWTQRIGCLLQSICSCRRIRDLDAGKVGWGDEEVFFYMEKITSCEKFCFVMYDGEHLLEILEMMDVKRKITLVFYRDRHANLEWMNNENIQNIPQLKLVDVRNLTFSQFLSLENEHLHLEHCKVNKCILNEYLKKWMNGEFTKRRTLRVTSYYWHGLDDKVFNGLTREPMETWEKLGKPGLVRFSDKLYLNPTPLTVPESFRTALLRNCTGQFATVVQTHREFYFTPWDLPLPPINIPCGHKLSESSEWPVAVIVHQNN